MLSTIRFPDRISCIMLPFTLKSTPKAKARHSRPAVGGLLKLMVLVLIGFGIPAPVVIDTIEFAGAETAYAAEEVVTPTGLSHSSEKTLASHRTELSTLRDRMWELVRLKETVRDEIKSYESENANYSQLLLLSRPPVENLENAIINNRLAVSALTNRFESLQKSYASVSNLFMQAGERIELVEGQITAIRRAEMPDAEKEKIEAIALELVEVLNQKMQLGDRYHRIFEDAETRINKALAEKQALEEKLVAQLENMAKTSIFTPAYPYRHIFGNGLPEAFSLFKSRLGGFLTLSEWQAHVTQFKMSGFYRGIVFLFWLALVIALQIRFNSGIRRIENKLQEPIWYHRNLGLILFRRSLLYFGLSFLFVVYGTLQFTLLDIGLVRVLSQIFLTLLLSRWGLDYLEYGYSGPSLALRSYVTFELRRVIRLLRVVVISGVIFIWLAGKESLLTAIYHDLFSLGLLVWTAMFWHRMTPIQVDGASKGQPAPNRRKMSLLKGWSYLVSGGGVLLGAAGYRVLASYWDVAWVKTLALLFLGWITLNAIREWHRDLRAQSTPADTEQPRSTSYHLRWSLIMIVRVVWLFCLVRGIIWAWDSSGLLMPRVWELFNLTYSIGNLDLSVRGIVTAAAILFITHLAVRIGRSLLNEHVLDSQTLERGFKSTILTISTYLGWAVGLLLVLNTIGVNATSLAVIFGALSVGIGFGLQNICNNFISGLILLFERPIQVGDQIEINGMWAEVKKIKVRATVVKTYDNASLIIPNSEFISKQVTNWSFKDKRMRRSLEVGVAYGSDVERVQTTLLEIAGSHPDVYKIPRPDVIFTDHAAAALIFRLRIWVHVDNYWTVPSRIRFDIDRRFRELGIEIAFPQQDVHIRTLPDENVPDRSTENS